MTPEQAALAAALLAGLEKIEAWPVWSVLVFLLVGPWVLSLVLSYQSQKRFESVVAMYENNSELVRDYENLSRELAVIIRLSTQTLTQLVTKIDAAGIVVQKKESCK